jgi:hypothetical protein
MLTKEDCADISAVVKEMQPGWRERQHGWTLGKATYLDLRESRNNNDNELLMTLFRPLYMELLKVLDGRTGYRCILHEGYAYPGFHIYQGNPEMPQGVAYGGYIHTDYPYRTLGFPDDSTVITFTLPIELPENGGGLNYWEAMTEDSFSGWYADLPSEQQVLFDSQVNYHQYEVGKLELHDGKFLHQIANMVPTTKDDWRITLQGHGVLVDDKMRIYF